MASWKNLGQFHIVKENDNTRAFFALLRAGLWESDIKLSPFVEIDFNAVYDLAKKQSVVGLVAAGIEHVSDMKVTKTNSLPFIKAVFPIFQRNHEMNLFIGQLIKKLDAAGITAVLVKGQGIAQCYERPLWRSSGDIDFFLSTENYEMAKKIMAPLAYHVDKEFAHEKHLGMSIDAWILELHGSLYCGLSSKIEKELDEIKAETFLKRNVRSWQNNDVTVFLLATENDVFYVFTHILQHFFKGGIGLRQFCDWCRLLWTYRASLDIDLLERRLRKSGLMSEWKAFGALAVNYLGMPAEAVPFYDASARWDRKAQKICTFIIKVGNFGKNRDLSYYSKYPYLIRKAVSLCQRLGDLCRHVVIFPLDSLRFMPRIVFNGVKSAIRGE